MRPAKLAVILILGVTMLACLAVSADEPATQPASTTQPSVNAGQLRRALRALSPGRVAGVWPYTQQEWDAMMAFMKENSPARWHAMLSVQMPNNSPVRLDAIRKWRNYNFTKEHFPAVADQLLRRFRLEDDLFALELTAEADDGTNTAQIHDLIRNKITEMVQLDFSERQTRIDKLQKMLQDEKAKLAGDQAEQDKVIDQRTDGIMKRLIMLTQNAAAPTTRPQTQDAVNPAPPATPHDPVVNVSSKDGDSK